MTRTPVAAAAPRCKVCAGAWPPQNHTIADLSLSIMYLFEDQFFPGRTVLVLKRHATELFELTREERSVLMEDATAAAHALQKAFTPVKINYELLGNQLPHIHWHIIPRLADDPAPREPIWTYRHPSRGLAHDELQQRIALIRQHLPGGPQ